MTKKNNNLLKKCVVKSSAQKMKFSIEDFFSKCKVTFTEEILEGNFHFLCSGVGVKYHSC